MMEVTIETQSSIMMEKMIKKIVSTMTEKNDQENSIGDDEEKFGDNDSTGNNDQEED